MFSALVSDMQHCFIIFDTFECVKSYVVILLCVHHVYVSNKKPNIASLVFPCFIQNKTGSQGCMTLSGDAVTLSDSIRQTAA